MSKGLKVDLISLISSLVIMIAAYIVNLNYDGIIVIILWLLAFIIGGRAKAIEGFKNTMKDKALNVEFLMIISAIGAFIIGYYQEGAILIFIFSLSGVLEEYSMDKAEKTLSSLMKLLPETAIKIIDDQEIMIPIQELEKDDIIMVKVGQQVPADGIIIRGSTYLNESAITGEAKEVYKDVGNHVISGTINESSAIYVKLVSAAKDSAMQKIVDFIKVAQTENNQTELGIKKFEKYYVYIVLLLSALLMLVPYLLNIWDLNTSIYRGIVLLVVASPCALVASVSPVMLSAMSNATKKGVLIRGSKAISQITKLKTIFFDKTGTITYGTPSVIEIRELRKISNEDFSVIYSVEKQSNHPLAKAIVKYLEHNMKVTLLDIETKELKGYGIESMIHDNFYFIGKKLINNDMVQNHQKDGYTTVEIIKNEELIGIITLKDEVRKDAIDTIERLKKQGLETVMITGDNSYSANEIAKLVKVDRVMSECLPEDKVNLIKNEKNEASVAMIGDGINDGPALAVADVGFAMGSGTDVAIETADVILMNNKLNTVPDIIDLAKRAKKVYTQNIVFSLAIIVFLVLMNVFQLISLPFGVVFHEGSTILVIINGLRLLRK